MSEPQQLTDLLMKDGSDVHLVFDEEMVPAHSLTLKHWSGVLRNALESTISSTRDGFTTIPMEGTKKEDWLIAMEFMYPVVPQPEVTWDNLEVSA